MLSNGGLHGSYEQSGLPSPSLTAHATLPPVMYRRGSTDNLSSLDSRGRSRSPGGHVSHKGALIIHIPSYVILVRPPGIGENLAPRDDTVLDGQLEVIMEKPRMAKSIRVTITATCRLQLPGEPIWQEANIFERSVEIAGNNPDGTPGIKLEKGSQRFEFHLILPSTLATYDRHPMARLTHNIKAVVEGINEKPAHSPFALFGGIGKGKQKEKSRGRSRPSSRATSPTGQRTPSTLGLRSHTASFDRQLNTLAQPLPGVSTPRDTPPPTPFGYSHDNSGSYATLSSLNPSYTPSYSIPEHADYVSVPMSRDNSVAAFEDDSEIKPLRGHLSTERHLIIAANPFEANTPNNLSIIKTGHLAGVGDWKLSLQSDEFSVGSYVALKLRFISPSPKATIFAVRLLLSQSYSVKSLEDPEAALVPCPKRNFLVCTEGTIPHEKRPTKEAAAMWRGSVVGHLGELSPEQLEEVMEQDFRVASGIKRLPDDTKARPSTYEGTITPIKVAHEFVLQVFFSVEGEDLVGNQINDGDASGVMRMLVLPIPVMMPSPGTLNSLPTYTDSETEAAVTSTNASLCACGYTLDQLAARANENEDDEIDRVDIDSLSLDARGRRRLREADRHKAQFERAGSGSASNGGSTSRGPNGA
ncbi:hypothetical protein QFC22_003898 [Naganishia vaughanmartiniae]|uniref:Uncharacterized protein n=1 Tax=Naganishia vaughanmartiniae TaxID=1424756 RepID=A0ACC2X4G9_9TREE|nr:hypothetical protein QFC22_003898 [Naganishia vaughanmartiniae]